MKTIIVDDEINARENLRYLVNTYCKSVEIVYEASNVDSALTAIKEYKPNLIFLDIEMPQKNGFQLINLLDNKDIYVIFVTAYDKYAVKAFSVSALDYLLKPIDIQQLKNAVSKASKSIEKDNVKQNFELLKANQKKLQKLTIPYKSDYVIIDIKNITAIQADRMYSVVYLDDGKTYTTSKKLSYYEAIFENLDFLFRVHRSWVVNSNHIFLYSKKNKIITLHTQQKIPISKSYKADFEALFKNS